MLVSASSCACCDCCVDRFFCLCGWVVVVDSWCWLSSTERVDEADFDITERDLGGGGIVFVLFTLARDEGGRRVAITGNRTSRRVVRDFETV